MSVDHGMVDIVNDHSMLDNECIDGTVGDGSRVDNEDGSSTKAGLS